MSAKDQPEFWDSGESGPDTGPAPAKRAIEQDIFCPGCGYNLRALTSNRCPECGHDLESIRGDESIIPWVHRRRIGWFRAYWKTVWLTSFHVNRLCNEMARPVSYADSQRFRWMTILHFFVPVLLASVFLFDLLFVEPLGLRNPKGIPPFGTRPPDPTFWEQAFSEIGFWALVCLFFLLFLIAVTGVPSYFFHPRRMPVPLQNRAVALSYYLCAPLSHFVFAPVGVAIFFGVWRLDPWLIRYWNPFLSIDEIAIGTWTVFAVVAFLCWWGNLIRAARRMMPQVDGRATLVALLVPLLWFALGGLILVAVPLAVFGILVVFASFG